SFAPLKVTKGADVRRNLARQSDRFDDLDRLLKWRVELAMLRYTAANDWLEVRDIANVNDQIDALHKGAHRIVSRETMAEQNDKIFPSQHRWAFHHLVQDRVMTGV